MMVARPSDNLVELIRLVSIGLVGLFLVLYLAHALFGTPDPMGFI